MCPKFYTNYPLQLKYGPNQIYPSKICFLTKPNTKHTMNYMHAEYLQSHQTIAYFLNERILALFFEYCKLVEDCSEYLHLEIVYQKLLPDLIALTKLRVVLSHGLSGQIFQ